MKKDSLYFLIFFIFAYFALILLLTFIQKTEFEILKTSTFEIIKREKEDKRKEEFSQKEVKREREKGEKTKESKEVRDDIVLISQLDKSLISEKIEQGKDFLLRMEEGGGFHKYYYPLEDKLEPRLHTPYSASIVLTFFYYLDFKEDQKILENLPKYGEFLLSMQNKEKKHFGAFHYSFFLKKKEKEKKFVVGTTALTIFTLLKFYDFTGEEKYLEAAKLGGDWLMTMQENDGKMRAYVRFSDGKWLYGKKESLLYEGQVLTALSRLYSATKEEKYKITAQKIAERFYQKYEKERDYIQGEYRPKNPISNAWVVYSLREFYQIERKEKYKKVVFELAERILKDQRTKNDPLKRGSFKGVYSSSGVGWISEVMAETFRFCQKEQRKDCEKYKKAVIEAMRWIIQFTISKEKSQNLKNPERAIGSIFWSKDKKFVRTDIVCHALNSYLRIYDFLEEGILLSLSE